MLAVQVGTRLAHCRGRGWQHKQCAGGHLMEIWWEAGGKLVEAGEKLEGTNKKWEKLVESL